MAVAAYNMGEEGLTAEMLEQNTRDFYQLYLPLETQRFIFRVIGAKLVLSAPDRYGFEVGRQPALFARCLSTPSRWTAFRRFPFD